MEHPHGAALTQEALRARRISVLAFAFLLFGVVDLAWRGVDTVSLRRTFPLWGLGGFSILIFGTMRLFISGMAGRDVALGGVGVPLSAALGALGIYAFSTSDPPLAALSSVVWGGATLVLTLASVLRPPVRPVVSSPPSSVKRPIRTLEVASLAYATLSAIAIPLSQIGLLAESASLHVTLVGFVVTTILSVASHLLPRFFGSEIPPALLEALVPLAIFGPLLLAWGLAFSPAPVPLGGLVEGAAFGVFGIIVLRLLARGNRTWRPHHALWAIAPLAVALGGPLALAFAFGLSSGGALSLHGFLVSFGFVGLVVLGMSTDLYGPSLSRGARGWKSLASLSTVASTLALALGAVGVAIGRGDLAQGGAGVYRSVLALHLAGLLRALRKAKRAALSDRGG